LIPKTENTEQSPKDDEANMESNREEKIVDTKKEQVMDLTEKQIAENRLMKPDENLLTYMKRLEATGTKISWKFNPLPTEPVSEKDHFLIHWSSLANLFNFGSDIE
jgi:hypothetical protein